MPSRERTRRVPREHTGRAILDAGLSTGAVNSNFKGEEDLLLTLFAGSDDVIGWARADAVEPLWPG